MIISVITMTRHGLPDNGRTPSARDEVYFIRDTTPVERTTGAGPTSSYSRWISEWRSR